MQSIYYPFTVCITCFGSGFALSVYALSPYRNPSLFNSSVERDEIINPNARHTGNICILTPFKCPLDGANHYHPPYVLCQNHKRQARCIRLRSKRFKLLDI